MERAGIIYNGILFVDYYVPVAPDGERGIETYQLKQVTTTTDSDRLLTSQTPIA
jgi:hypothetical protein